MSEANEQNDIAVNTVYRILDANSNRAAEACRVIEDYCRFSAGDKRLSEAAKQIRHEVRAVSIELTGRNRHQLLAIRDTEHDVGTEIQVENQLGRQSVAEVVLANFSRLQESLRVLEEYSKLISSDSSAQLESIRYETYKLQKSLSHLMRAQQILRGCILCVLTDAADSESALAERVSMLIAAGVDMIQLREKRLEDRELLNRALIVRKLTAHQETLFVVNDRADICALANADGVHVGQTDLSVSAARRMVGKKIVGVSTHSLSQAEAAVRDGADYIGVGPVFASKTKQFNQLQGCQLLKQVSCKVSLPVFAIGGVSEENISTILESGSRRVAVSAGVLQAEDPATTARRIRQAIVQVNCQTADNEHP